jgi:hypothetical protein
VIDKYIKRIKEIESDFNRKILEEVQKLDENEEEAVFTYLIMSLASKLILTLSKYDIESRDDKIISNKIDRLIVALRVLVSADIEGLLEMHKENKSSFCSRTESETIH